MNYDLFGAGDDTTGHHANLYKGNQAMMPASKQNRSIQSAVSDHIEFGIPREKILLGIPFYGKRWKEVEPETNGLYQPGIFDRGLSQDRIHEIKKILHSNNFGIMRRRINSCIQPKSGNG